MPRRPALPTLPLVLVIAACPPPATTPPATPPARECRATDVPDGLQRVDTPVVHLDAPSSPHVDILRADLQGYLRTLWSMPTLEVRTGAPEASAPTALWLGTTTETRDAAGRDVQGGYVLRRTDDGGVTRLVAYAPDEKNLAFATYALLERLGARFFHPMQELIPARDGAYLPTTLDVTMTPAMAVRGIHLHLLHPTEYFKPFNEAGEKNLADAKRFVDWLVKTGQNHLQWWILVSMDLPTWLPHAAQILDYAHLRGLTVGSCATLWAGSSLQNAYDLVTDDNLWQEQMSERLAWLFQLPWDQVELGLGEFLGFQPEELLTWLDFAVAHVAQLRPGAQVSVVNHVGNYENLYMDFRGQRTFFYHLPGYADPRLINSVHTVFWFDLYREWAMYEHENFHLQRDFILAELPERKVRYFPESAYWVTADVDVPAFLPEFIHARWLDIHNLDADIRERGLPPLDGHVMFSSGHEWGYWMADYLSARALWEPSRPLEDLLGHYASAYGSCASDVASTLRAFMTLQEQYLFDRRLIPYISGEDAHDDFGALSGILTHPRRVQFHELLARDDAGRAQFEDDVVKPVQELADRIAAEILPRMRPLCAGADETLRPWCAELLDGMEIVELKLRHSVALNRAVLDAAALGDRWEALLGEAEAFRARGAEVIARREAHYRFDLETLVGAYDNPTVYEFGYLRQAHVQCFWTRQELQARMAIVTGVEPEVTDLPTCLQ
ncbi:MAG: hypothetical protein AB2A00_08315 [Myxococcota bacterium]